MDYRRNYRLRHDIDLLIDCAYGPFFSLLLEFLSGAVTHFKQQRDICKTGAYADGPYIYESFDRGSEPVIGMYLTHGPDEKGGHLTVDQWLEAVVEAFSVAETIDNLFSQIFYPPSYERKSTGPVSIEELLQCNPQLSFAPGGWAAEALGHVNDPLGRFIGLDIALRHRLGLPQEH